MDETSASDDHVEEAAAPTGSEPAPTGRRPTIVATFLKRGAGQGVLVGAVTGFVGLLVGLQAGADSAVLAPGQAGLPIVFAIIAGFVGLLVGPIVGLLAAGACLYVRESIEGSSLAVRTATMATVGGVVAGACAGLGALMVSHLVGSATGYVVVATVLGALAAGRTERVWTRRQG
ncbi:hypothetical protein EDF38_3103 [Frigoribacterium sp. PhB160]|uniref:hypothetical protein n=1 Tax=Frigoribacterium sp. PhB160 TaxID=2485192 RepID=UPI000F497B3C|nr:hypothetical protein [Frigoribacterium sp. PhB160]ROS58358.1 hypothetical protein EDF38_3103 [Frigoribacterium sp. PhB160]